MDRPNGSTTKWIGLLIAIGVGVAGFTWGAAKDSVRVVDAKVDTLIQCMDTVENRVNVVERDTTEVKTDVKYILQALQRIEQKVDQIASP